MEMTVRVEIWPVAADSFGIWLLSGNDAWRPSLPVMADSEPHAEVQMMLHSHGIADEAALLHSTSWRTDGTSVILTYLAVIAAGDMVRDEWQNALPIGLELVSTVGKPEQPAPTDAPAPRYVDVLIHGLRHLQFLVETDSKSREALGGVWHQHLRALSPALAGMYE